ncbi:MAG TPA: T9SS type A sorting domain-containing protein, partial [Candidatus Kapabacteria bacterium]|nr:T9SS type A sorting domain-containing protein [Candidatus Kapabacteria bacterium]
VNPPNDTLDYSIVPLSTPKSLPITLVDTGTYRYDICGIRFGYPIDSIVDLSTNKQIPNGGQLGRPVDINGLDSLLSLNVWSHLDIVGDTTVPIFVDNCLGWCANWDTIWVHIAAAQTILSGTDFPAVPTYINCRQDSGKIRARNESPGGPGWNLTSVAIVSTPGNTDVGEFDLIEPGTGAHKPALNFNNLLLKPGQSYDIEAVYHPTKVGNVSATVRYTFDSLGLGTHIEVRDRVLTGTGRAEKTTMTAANPIPWPANDTKHAALPPGSYAQETAKSFDVPISFTLDTLPKSADVQKVTLDVTFKEDLFTNVTFTPNSQKFNATSNAPGVRDGNGNVTVSITATTTNGPLVTVDEIGKLNLTVADAKDQTSNFVITNMTYYDGGGNSICYIVTDTIPGTFIPDRLCGDPTLIKFLENGQISMRIESLTPNPASQDKSPVLTYKLYQANTPVKIDVYNLLGEKVASVQDEASLAAGTYQVQIPVTDLQSGTYTVMVSTPNSTKSQQFILNR